MPLRRPSRFLCSLAKPPYWVISNLGRWRSQYRGFPRMFWFVPGPMMPMPAPRTVVSGKGVETMPRYVIERTFPGGLSIPIDQEGAAVARKVISRNSELGVTWLHSYVSDD